MDGDKEIWRLKRQILASKERQKSYTWQIRGTIAIGIMGVLALVAAILNWVFLLTPILVIGMAAIGVCAVAAIYYVVRSFVVQPPVSDGAENSTPDQANNDHPTSTS